MYPSKPGTPNPKSTFDPPPPPTGPQIVITGFLDSQGQAVAPTSVPPQFRVIGTLTNFDAAGTITCRILRGTTQVDSKNQNAAANWSFSFDLTDNTQHGLVDHTAEATYTKSPDAANDSAGFKINYP